MKDFASHDATLEAINVDDIGRMLMALAQEVWVMRDRMAVTEKLLEAKAGIGPADIEGYVADAVTRGEIERMRDLFAAKILGAPVAAHERSVDAILERAGFAPRGAAQ